MNDRLLGFLAGKNLQLRKMDSEHYIDFFDCGRDAALTKWFCDTALRWQNEDMCTVWVLSRANNATDAVGFFTLPAHQIIPGNVAKNERATQPINKPWVNGLLQPFPAQLLGKFALDQSEQGKGVGAVLMLCAYAKHVEVADVSGAKFLVLDARGDKLSSYYCERYGFARSGLAGEMAQMYRPTSAIRAELEAALDS